MKNYPADKRGSNKIIAIIIAVVVIILAGVVFFRRELQEIGRFGDKQGQMVINQDNSAGSSVGRANQGVNSSEEEADEIRELVRDYYASYIDYLNAKFSQPRTKTNEGLETPAFSEEYVLPSFIDSHNQPREDLRSSHDPILCAQDYPRDASELEVELVETSEKSAKARVVAAKGWGSIQVSLQKRESWRISGIECVDGSKAGETEKNGAEANNGANEFDSQIVNLSFSPPEGSFYQEKDLFGEKNSLLGGVEHQGKKVQFFDKNNLMPEFSAVTRNFSAGDLVVHDLIEGNLESKDSFKARGYEEKYSRKIEKGQGIYQFIGYTNQNCSPAVNSYLFVKPPRESDLKYISFYLGSASEFDSGSCDPGEALIEKKVAEIENTSAGKANNRLEKALKIARTFNIN